MPLLTNSQGEPTGAVYGMVNMLKRLLADYDPVYVGLVFDAEGKTFRDDMYDQYKANRPSMPEELARQIGPIHELVAALGFPIVTVPGVEADDVIGTLAKRATVEGLATVISTGDKDLAQLVNEHVTLVNTMDNSRLDPAGVEAKFDVPPRLMVDYLSLVGDVVDNVPGVPTVGPKTAAKWLRQHGSLDAIMAHAGEVKGKVGEKLRASLDQLPLSRDLVTIKCDVDVGLEPRDLRLMPPDREKLKALYSRFEFKTWLSELLQADTGSAGDGGTAQARGDYETVLDEAQLQRWLDRLTRAELFAFDTETTSLDYMVADIVGVSFAVEPGHAAYVPVAHD